MEAYEGKQWLALVGPGLITLWALCGGMLRYLPQEDVVVKESLIQRLLRRLGSRTPAPAPVFRPQSFIARITTAIVFGVPHCPPLAAIFATLIQLITQPQLTRRIYPRALGALFGVGFLISAATLVIGVRAGELNYVVGGSLTFSIGYASLSQACSVTLDGPSHWREEHAVSPSEQTKEYVDSADQRSEDTE